MELMKMARIVLSDQAQRGDRAFQLYVTIAMRTGLPIEEIHSQIKKLGAMR